LSPDGGFAFEFIDLFPQGVVFPTKIAAFLSQTGELPGLRGPSRLGVFPRGQLQGQLKEVLEPLLDPPDAFFQAAGTALRFLLAREGKGSGQEEENGGEDEAVHGASFGGSALIEFIIPPVRALRDSPPTDGQGGSEGGMRLI
jgi:hypothetical protein